VKKSNINCKVCGSKLPLEAILTLKNAPPSAQGFVRYNKKKNNINLKISQCSICGLVQSSNKPVKYYRETIRSVSFSKSMINFRSVQLKKFIKKYNLTNKKIVEIGSGSGEYLNILKKYSKNSNGLEYSNKNITISKKKGLSVFKGYVDNKNYKIQGGPYDAFICMSFAEHSPDINNFLRGISNNLRSNSYGLIEVPNFDMIIKKNLYTEFIIDHLNYFTKKTLEQTLNFNGFEVLNCKELWDGYIISAEIKKKNLLKKFDLNILVKNLKQDFKKFKKNLNKKIAVWGAGHQALTVLSLTGLKNNVKYIIDSATFKQNKLSPGDKIKVVSPSIINKENISGVIIMAAGYSDEVYNILKKMNFKGKIAILRHNRLEFK